MELFVKRFIDLLDEKMPVTMVHTIVEQPLGAVMLEHHIRIHARLELTDKESPFLEIDLFPNNQHEIEIIYAFTFPKRGIEVKEDVFIKNIMDNPNIQGKKIVPIENTDDYYYEAFYAVNARIPENNIEIDESINQLISEISRIMAISEYGLLEEE